MGDHGGSAWDETLSFRGPARDLELARIAFQEGDAELSRKAHDVKKYSDAKEDHANGGDFVKSVAFGGLDGIITTFAIVCTVAGAGKPAGYVLLFGTANLIADALSMGMGDFLSSKSEMDYQKVERSREKWELDNHPEGEKQEMIEIYTQKGYTEEDATLIINTMAKVPEFFIDHMCTVELGLLPPSEDDANDAIKNGFVTFGAFIVFGAVPLVPYLMCLTSADVSSSVLFVCSCVLVAVSLLALGFTKARLMRGSVVKDGIKTLTNGGAVAIVAYLVAWGLEHALGV